MGVSFGLRVEALGLRIRDLRFTHTHTRQREREKQRDRDRETETERQRQRDREGERRTSRCYIATTEAGFLTISARFKRDLPENISPASNGPRMEGIERSPNLTLAKSTLEKGT